MSHVFENEKSKSSYFSRIFAFSQNYYLLVTVGKVFSTDSQDSLLVDRWLFLLSLQIIGLKCNWNEYIFLCWRVDANWWEAVMKSCYSRERNSWEIEMGMMRIHDVADRWSGEPEVSHWDLRLGKRVCPFLSGDCFEIYFRFKSLATWILLRSDRIQRAWNSTLMNNDTRFWKLNCHFQVWKL